MTIHRLGQLLCLTALLVVGGGCSWVQELKLPVLTPEGKQLPDAPDALAAPKVYKYPDNAPIAEPLEIEVIREGKGIRLDNRTTRTFQNAELWLNHEYGGDLPSIPVGRGELISLKEFRNEFDESYPTARFLYPDNDKPLVMADLVIDGKVHKLIVRLVEDWRHP